MGRVIKGSLESPGHYLIKIPAMAAAAVVARDPQRPARRLLDADGYDIGEADDDDPVQPESPVERGPDLEAIKAQAQQLMDDAADSAALLVDDARERARALTDAAAAATRSQADDARRQAHDEGYLAGAQAAKDETTAMLSTLRGLLESMRLQRHALMRTAEPELVRLALAIAERVLHQQIALDPGVVIEMAKAAIARIVDRETIVVRVNPADIAEMREHRDALLALGDVKTMRVIEDQRVDRGGVIIETDAGNIDAKISTQLAEARKILHIVDDVVVQPLALPASHELALSAAQAS